MGICRVVTPYLLLGKVLAVQGIARRADIHESLLKTGDVVVHKGDAEVEHGVRGRGALQRERGWDLYASLMHLQAAGDGLSVRHDGEAGDQES